MLNEILNRLEVLAGIDRLYEVCAGCMSYEHFLDYLKDENKRIDLSKTKNYKDINPKDPNSFLERFIDLHPTNGFDEVVDYIKSHPEIYKKQIIRRIAARSSWLVIKLEDGEFPQDDDLNMYYLKRKPPRLTPPPPPTREEIFVKKANRFARVISDKRAKQTIGGNPNGFGNSTISDEKRRAKKEGDIMTFLGEDK